MAEKETRNKPKDVVEAIPEEIVILESDGEVAEQLEELEIASEPGRELSKEEKEEEKRQKSIAAWEPKTKLGRDVKSGKETDIDKVLSTRKKILESEIVDKLLPTETDLILIGQGKGKFGGGKRRAWRQTQKKTKEGNVLTFSSMAVVGDRKGHIGVGYGKSKETLPAREKAIRQAKLSIIKVRRGYETAESGENEPHTIPFKVHGKCGSVKIMLLPAPRGTGLVIGDECKKVLRLVGIKDIYGVTRGQSRTTFNLIKACIDALNKTNEEII